MAHDLDAEITAALTAVREASRLCRRAQGRLAEVELLTKSDNSPVTVADFAAQAVVCATLVESLGPVTLVGEEDSDDLREADRTSLLEGVVALVEQHRGTHLDSATVLDWIAVGSAAASGERYWTLDPIDGTKGFLRGEQYAIALALIDRGTVQVGVLGCPNLRNVDGSTGTTFVAVEGSCTMYNGDSDRPSPCGVSEPATVAESRFCESVEAGHSDQGESARVASLLGIDTEPLRIDSQCKYGAIARGDASIYLRLPTSADYREKIWDHAAGKFVVEQAGGRVTDVFGVPLDFGQGVRLELNRGVIATSGRIHDDVVSAVQQVLNHD